MRYCLYCQRWTAGRPVYCPNCGRTWNHRICPRGHLNPSSALFCADCGSPDLSETSGKERWFSKIAGIISGVLPKILLVGFIVLILANINERSLEPLAGFIISISILFVVFTLMPRGIKRLILTALSFICKIAGNFIKSRGDNVR